jgi:hypothetical protein
MEKSLDRKIARILADSACRDFILADAKDADMAYGLSAPGQSPEHHSQEGKFRTLDEYRQLIREVVAQGLVDILLMSASTSEVLTLGERIFDHNHITPAVRANDTTDIWLAGAGARYGGQPAKPFRSATLDHIMCGKAECQPHERGLGADLGLYSITLNNDVELDWPTLEAYKAFRLEAEAKGFRHFLEVFEPNACAQPSPPNMGKFLADHIVRTLAGVTSRGRPLFLKIPYHGPAAMEALVRYDRSLVVGILGGASGTTFDSFHMLWEAKRYGARAALYGRRINNAEHQLTFIRYLRAIADDQIEPAEAVRAYHADLAKLNIRPYRSLEEDMIRGELQTAYNAAARKPAPAASARAAAQGDEPDFSRMTPAEKAMWNMERWKRIIG